ncbi:hypothetical protein GX51_04787 [Blastomyces parvus]|uniref:Uncharacterized protein n=1 Tax=Blastomyces parvus TaxID=2060905 RepID=A0A2B7X084_9EURO|nr:hypothetical protein GX51_04787 [Blastomyces parvus]
MTAPEEWEEGGGGSERMFRAIHDEGVLLSHQGDVKVLNCDNEVVLRLEAEFVLLRKSLCALSKSKLYPAEAFFFSG